MKFTIILAIGAFLVSWHIMGGGMVAFWVLLAFYSLLVGFAGLLLGET